MSTVGAVKAFTVSIASGVTATSAIYLGGAYSKIMVGIPTMTSATDIFPKVSDTSTGTFRAVYHQGKVDSTTPTQVNWDSSVTNCYVPLAISAQYLKLEYTSALTDSAQTFKVICSTN